MTPSDLLSLITSRRSSVLIDASRPVDDAVIDEMLLAAQYAPNHKRTWPMRFCVVGGDSRLSLGESIAEAMATKGDDPAKIDKTRTKYARAPRIIIVASAAGHSDTETEENLYASAAGVQNMLLVAHAHGLSTLWGSPAKGCQEAIIDFAGFDTDDHVIGLVYVGWPSKAVDHVDRPAPRATRRD